MGVDACNWPAVPSTSTVNDPFDAAVMGLGLGPPPPQLVAHSVIASSPSSATNRARRLRDIGSVTSTIPGTTPSDVASIHSCAGKSAAVVLALMVSVELPAGPAPPGVIDGGANEHFKLGGKFAQESWKVCPAAFCNALNEMLKVAD